LRRVLRLVRKHLCITRIAISSTIAPEGSINLL
jgi:hypothetical protein